MRQASIAEARAGFSSLVNQVAHGRERIVLTSRGRPKAALVGLDDLHALEDLSVAGAADEASLIEADLLVERIREDRGGVPLSDSVEDLHAIREGEPR